MTHEIEAAAAVLGVSLGHRTRSRQHSHRPKARDHVRRYLAVSVLGLRASHLALVLGLNRSTVLRSLRIGRDLVRDNARALGLAPEDFRDNTRHANGHDMPGPFPTSRPSSIG